MRSRRSVRPRARAEAVGERPLQPTGERDRVGIAVRDVPAVAITPKLIQPPRASVLRLRRTPRSRTDPRDRVRVEPSRKRRSCGLRTDEKDALVHVRTSTPRPPPSDRPRTGPRAER
jgi:hypothetical protein